VSKDARDKIAEMVQVKYGKLIMKIVYGITKDYNSAEDIKQEVVLKCVMKHETLEKLHERQIYSYICTAAKNTAINAREKMLREEASRQKYIEENRDALMINYVDFKAFDDNHEFSDETITMLKSIAPVDRDILLMKHYVGLSNQEVAEALGMTEANVKKRYQRVKIRLMSRLIEQEGDEIDE